MEEDIAISISVTEDYEEVHLDFSDSEGSVFDIYTPTEDFDKLCIAYLETMGYEISLRQVPACETVH